MLWKNFRFKNLNFWGSYQKNLWENLKYCYILQERSDDMNINTSVIENSNYHGGMVSHTILWVRYFNFTGVVVWRTKQQRWIAWELLQKNIVVQPNVNWNEYYDLFFEDDNGVEKTCKVKVSKPITLLSNDINDSKITFSFQLTSPSEKIYGRSRKNYEFWLWYLGGNTIPFTIPYIISWYAGYISLNNEWNWYAPFEIKIVWKCTNPRIINITNWQKYRLEYVSSNMVYSTLNQDFNIDPLVVEDLGINIKKYRASWSKIYLEPGENKLVVLSDDPTENPQIFLKFRDSFSY